MAISLSEAGATVEKDAAGHWQVRIGIYLPGITFWDGYRVQVRLIQASDQFIRGIEPKGLICSGMTIPIWAYGTQRWI